MGMSVVPEAEKNRFRTGTNRGAAPRPVAVDVLPEAQKGRVVMQIRRAAGPAGCLLIALLTVCSGGAEEPYTTDSGLTIQVLEQGGGRALAEGQRAVFRYTVWLEDGTMVESNDPEHGGEGRAISARIGEGRVIQAWDEGIVGMRPGEVRRLVAPPELAWGDEGSGEMIPPGATLTFEIRLVEIR